MLVDSDTIWTDGTLPELVKPFADAAVGGVDHPAAHPRARAVAGSPAGPTGWRTPGRSTRCPRSPCSARSAACRDARSRSAGDILVRVMDEFMTQKFLGVFLEVSDDRTLTNLTLKEGYRTVYQYTSLVYTDAPLQVKKLAKQQLRWARGSQYNTLRMLPWMLGHAPVLAIFFLADIVLPFLLFGTIAGWIYRAVTGTGINLYQAILETYTGLSGWVWVVALDDRLVRAVDGDPADPAPAREAVRLLPAARLHHRLDVLPHADPAARASCAWRTPAAGARAPAPTPAAASDDLIAELETRPTAPADVVDRAPRACVPTQRRRRTPTAPSDRAAGAPPARRRAAAPDRGPAAAPPAQPAGRDPVRDRARHLRPGGARLCLSTPEPALVVPRHPPVARTRIAAAGVALALVAVTAGVWLSPSVAVTDVAPEGQRRARSRLARRERGARATPSTRARTRSTRSSGSQAKAAAERKAAAESGKAKAAAEQAGRRGRGRAEGGGRARRGRRPRRGQGRRRAEPPRPPGQGAVRAAARGGPGRGRRRAAPGRAAQASAPQPAPRPGRQAAPAPPLVAALAARRSASFGLYTAAGAVQLGRARQRRREGRRATPTIVGYFQGWDEPFRADAVDAGLAAGHAAAAHLGVAAARRPRNDQADDPEYSLPTIIDGAFDAYLHQYARDIAALGPAAGHPPRPRDERQLVPVVARATGSGELAQRQQPRRLRADVAPRARHLRGRGRQRSTSSGSGRRTSSTTCPTARKTDARTCGSLYPGDEYVDWVGLSGYYRPPYKAGPDADLRLHVRPLASTSCGRSPDKPILLAEIGASEIGGNKPAWVADLFAGWPGRRTPTSSGSPGSTTPSPPSAAGERVTNDWRIDVPRGLARRRSSTGLHDPAAGIRPHPRPPPRSRR